MVDDDFEMKLLFCIVNSLTEVTLLTSKISPDNFLICANNLQLFYVETIYV